MAATLAIRILEWETDWYWENGRICFEYSDYEVHEDGRSHVAQLDSEQQINKINTFLKKREKKRLERSICHRKPQNPAVKMMF